MSQENDTLNNLIDEYSVFFSKQPDASKAIVIINQINETNKSPDLKNMLIKYKDIYNDHHINEFNNILSLIMSWIVHAKINTENEEKWDLWVSVYTHILRYRCNIISKIAPALFTFKNVERCKQIITLHVRYKYQFNIEPTPELLDIIDLYPNLQTVVDWWRNIYDTMYRYDYYNIVCITRNSYELAKLLKNGDIPVYSACEKVCDSDCITYKCMNPEKFGNLYSAEQAAAYKYDKTSQLLSIVQQPWKPSLNKYWPYSFREFVKTMLLIYNRKKVMHISKDSLFCIIRMLPRCAFSNNLLNILNSQQNILINTNRLILDFCVVCGKLTKNICVTCRKQGIETRYCGLKCIEYDWNHHKKLHM